MASIIDDPNGRRRIEFVAEIDGQKARRKIRLGLMSRKDADTILVHVHNLLASQKSGRLEAITEDWLTKTTGDIHADLVRYGLTRPRVAPGATTVGAFIDAYIAD